MRGPGQAAPPGLFDFFQRFRRLTPPTNICSALGPARARLKLTRKEDGVLYYGLTGGIVISAVAVGLAQKA